MNVADETVFVVDDDESLCSSLEWMLSAEGLTCETFRSGEAFLDRYKNDPGCLLLDVRMPGMGGLELQEELKTRGLELPIIFVSGHADVPIAVNAMRQGAMDVIEKPFDKRMLIDRILSAFERDRSNREQRMVRASLEERMELLTPREREVFAEIVKGLSNKEVAFELGLSARTVEKHKERVLRKMRVGSPAELIRVATEHALA